MIPTSARVLALVVLANLEAVARFRADRPTAWVGSEGFTAHTPNSGTPDQVAAFCAAPPAAAAALRA